MVSFLLHHRGDGSVHSFSSFMNILLGDTEEQPENLSDDELVQAVERLRGDVHVAKLENEIFEKYLQAVNPIALLKLQAELEEINRAIDARARRKRVASVIDSSHYNAFRSSSSLERMEFRRRTRIHSSTSLQRSSILSLSAINLQSIFQESDTKLSIACKESVAARVADNLRDTSERFQLSAKDAMADLSAEIQTNSIMLQDVKDSAKKFDSKVIVEGRDSIAGRICADKLMLYVKEWFKKHDRTIEKLRLISSTTNLKLARVTKRIEEKTELGDKISVGDFEKLKVLNRDRGKKLDERNHELAELKKLCARGIMSVSNSKETLKKQDRQLKTMEKDLEKKEDLLKSLSDEKDRVQKQVLKAEEKLQDVKRVLDSFQVPDTFGYVETTAKIKILKSEIKKWTRKKQLQDEYSRLVTGQLRVKSSKRGMLSQRELQRGEMFQSRGENIYYY